MKDWKAGEALMMKTKDMHAAPIGIQLYDASEADRVPWPDTEDGRYARDYLLPLLREGTARYIANTETRLMVLRIDDMVLPVTVNEAEYGNSYVCSPYTHYIAYAIQELAMLQKPWLEHALKVLLRGLGLLCRATKFNRVVHVNNWLLSTNLYPEMNEEQLNRALAFMVDAFPRHAVVFRSVNTRTNPTLHEALRGKGCKLVGSRQIYVYETGRRNGQNAKSRWLLKRDGQLLERNGYEACAGNRLTEQDMPRIKELYDMLYLDKYSKYNPQFSERFLTEAWRTGTLEFIALRKQGRIDAVLGYYARNGAMTTPVFGYDTSLPAELGLYRMLSAVLIQEAERRGLLLNESSGAAQFKRNRGALGHLEYNAVHDCHLPRYRRICWSILSVLINRVGVPLMQKWKL